MNADIDFATQRAAMVRDQLAARGVTDTRVLDAMRRVRREEFVPSPLAGEAYADRALPISLYQTISQPYMVAVMTAALETSPDAHVLEVGTGSGYQAAVLSLLVHNVITIERHAALAEEAMRRLESAGYSNVRVLVGDGTEGHLELAPYDAILVTAGAPQIPEALKMQLAEGGRLVIPVGTASHQDLIVVTRSGATFREHRGEGCVFVPLVGREGWQA
jgi:protein-L-isoaspartate(D-aspartate) O-methyltransferase